MSRTRIVHGLGYSIIFVLVVLLVYSLVVNRGARPSKIDALLAEIKAGNVQAVASLLEGGVDTNGVGENGVRPLVWAGYIPNTNIVRLLLQHGADPNVVWEEVGETPLGAVLGAEWPESFAVLKLLLAAGADPSQPCSGTGELPVEMARRLRNNKAVNELERFLSSTPPPPKSTEKQDDSQLRQP